MAQSWGGRMEGAEESTDLWRHPYIPILCSTHSYVDSYLHRYAYRDLLCKVNGTRKLEWSILNLDSKPNIRYKTVAIGRYSKLVALLCYSVHDLKYRNGQFFVFRYLEFFSLNFPNKIPPIDLFLSLRNSPNIDTSCLVLNMVTLTSMDTCFIVRLKMWQLITELVVRHENLKWKLWLLYLLWDVVLWCRKVWTPYFLKILVRIRLKPLQSCAKTFWKNKSSKKGQWVPHIHKK